MKTITDAFGKTQYLSDEVYELLGSLASPNYAAGTKVRLISGVDDSPTPGYHFNSDYVTICRINAPRAEFLGTRKANIKKVT